MNFCPDRIRAELRVTLDEGFVVRIPVDRVNVVPCPHLKRGSQAQSAQTHSTGQFRFHNVPVNRRAQIRMRLEQPAYGEIALHISIRTSPAQAVVPAVLDSPRLMLRAITMLALFSAAMPLAAQNGFRIDELTGPLLAQVQTTTWHAGCPVSPSDLRVLSIAYLDYSKATHAGRLIVHKDVAQEVLAIFQDLYNQDFQIAQMRPIEEYGGNDNRSMAANNTSAFNCRDITGQKGKFSNHSWGRAIDINPLTNPYVKGITVLPPEGRAHLDRTRKETGVILANGLTVKRFQQDGWLWGGGWTDRQDYQHFEKPEPGR
jgi:hypothetical protein